MDVIKIRNFCDSKDIIKKVTRQPTEWEKIFANCMSDKGLVSRIYKEPLQLNSKKTNNLILKWAKDLNRHFSKECVQMASKHEKMLNILAIREMHMRTTIRYHFTHN